jgi:hypothetical protein
MKPQKQHYFQILRCLIEYKFEFKAELSVERQIEIENHIKFLEELIIGNKLTIEITKINITNLINFLLKIFGNAP